ncbi:MAG: PAS domain-containing protein, partial [Rhodospirillaceae bacterium]|nr:PAS domain-containing protein [Rhodospirillaceae bacterium]
MGPNPRILIAAADPEAAAMQALLSDLGYAVCAAASSGRQALAAVEELPAGARRPDLALIDTALDAEGVAAAGPLRRKFGVPSIFLSAAALPADLARIARLAEPAGYVSKPVVPWHLQVTIDTALAQHRRETELAEHARRLETELGKRDQLEAAFGDQTELLHTVVNSISEGLIVVDRSGRYLISNPAMKRIIGMYKPDSDLLERSEVYGLYYPDRTTLIPSDRLPLARALHGESTDLFDIFVRNEKRPEGVLVSTSARPLYDVQGTLRGGVVVFRDITRLRHTQSKLRETASRMEEQSRAMQTVIDSMS